jgi:hypothetical protein
LVCHINVLLQPGYASLGVLQVCYVPGDNWNCMLELDACRIQTQCLVCHIGCLLQPGYAWLGVLQVCYVPGVTLYLDFPFPAFPDNLGHWAELLLPMHSVFSSPSWAQHLQGQHKHIDRCDLLQ